ncbi:DUF4267 domain-containing protein [Georgenia subflava]|uniref:DUF4267 domain-containing protein n=1 Tax=Georgenia subflava TaxID=1622177 RepID=A0A6N7EEI6_9MICO|nr:DUF4267 domain-containing protein [Georgenia subflava]MPV35761.1 DUF4267 domain-containing protein [Georgenia subflava]
MTAAGMAIAGLAGVGILIVGLCYLATPRAMAASFGLPTLPEADATPWLRLKGIRDLTTGVVALVLLVLADPHVLAWAVIAFALIPLGDAVTVLRAGGSRAAALGIHGTTVVVMLVGAALLLAA